MIRPNAARRWGKRTFKVSSAGSTDISRTGEAGAVSPRRRSTLGKVFEAIQYRVG